MRPLEVYHRPHSNHMLIMILLADPELLKRLVCDDQRCKLQIRPRDHLSTSLVDTGRGQAADPPFMHSGDISIRA